MNGEFVSLKSSRHSTKTKKISKIQNFYDLNSIKIFTLPPNAFILSILMYLYRHL